MVYFGACYYPEHWTERQARKHIPLMRKAGFNVVRMGEFAWAMFEPEPDRYEFGWLDETIAALYQAGIATVMCTPTCVPPQWVLQRHPDILQVNKEGRVRNPGSRCHACKNAPEYQLLSERITQELARHYAGVEGVVGWQTDNEFGCHGTTRCYCSHCEKAFRDWLLEKYHDIDVLNQAWGTAFWGFRFRQWNEVPLPKSMPAGTNPGHWLDFARFSSDTQVAFQKSQYEIIKAACPRHFVTHNFMGRFSQIDYNNVAKFTDFSAWDNYPDAQADFLETAYAHEITRSFRSRFWVMEQKSGPTGDSVAGLLGEQPDPGDIRRWTWQAIANGAEGISFFRWRACLTGAEQYWHGILDHDGVPRRRYAEVRKTGKEWRKASGELKGAAVRPPAAVIRSFPILWALERQPGASGFSYDGHCFDWYCAVRRCGHSCGVVGETADLSRYQVVIAPCLAIVDDQLVVKLNTFVDGGGTLVLTRRNRATGHPRTP